MRLGLRAGGVANPRPICRLRQGGLRGREGGYGRTANLWETYLSLSILTLLGEPPDPADTERFVDALEVPSIGFAKTPESRRANLEVTYGGVMCRAQLGLPIRCRADVLAFVLACQAAHGGFARAPAA